MANVLILERAIGEIHIEDYPALTRLIIHDQQASCNDISANPWTTVRIGFRTCQNVQHSSEPKDVTMTTLRTVELTALTFNTPWIYVILGGTGVVILIFIGMIVLLLKEGARGDGEEAVKYSCEPPHHPQSCQRLNQRHSDAQPDRGAHPSDCYIDLCSMLFSNARIAYLSLCRSPPSSSTSLRLAISLARPI
ncbi:uncharacterized protein LOC134270940 [Saccostrea cucullata]|uniref:uncharacterized protein LOC134270940 n=1 Tax=Saccostrea cuccullata TaxID=36930 RepID=UPI002ED1B178